MGQEDSISNEHQVIMINEEIETLKDKGSISDGYHTFNELYDFRLALTKALFSILYKEFKRKYNVNPIWRSKVHDDGTMFKGYFVVGAFPTNQHFGKEEALTFHYPIEHWNLFWFAQEFDKAPPYDGHTSQDVLERLKNL